MRVKLGNKSKKNLSAGLDYRLVHLALESARRLDFICDWGVFETKRTIEQQRKNVANGVSKTMNSKHIPDKLGIVRAMDIVAYVDGAYSWSEKYYKDIIPKIKKVAEELYPDTFEFGYDWGWDMPHIEIKTGKELK